jgi:hypothetical protein
MIALLIAVLSVPPAGAEGADDVLKVRQGEGIKPLEIKGRVVDEGAYYIVYFKKGKSEKIFKENVVEFIPARRAATPPQAKAEPKERVKVGASTSAPTKADATGPEAKTDAVPTPDADPRIAPVEKTLLPGASDDFPPPTIAESRYAGVDPEVLKKYEFLIVNWQWIVGGAIASTALMVVILTRLLPARTAGPAPTPNPQNKK